MRKDRLLRLADLLDKDASDPKGIKFDLAEWAVVGDKDNPVSCGTAACAMGLAALSGEFKEEGLSLHYWGNGGMGFIDVYYDRNVGLNAAVCLFEISYEAAQFLFTPKFYPIQLTTGAEGERYVAKRIRDLVAEKFPDFV